MGGCRLAAVGARGTGDAAAGSHGGTHLLVGGPAWQGRLSAGRPHGGMGLRRRLPLHPPRRRLRAGGGRRCGTPHPRLFLDVADGPAAPAHTTAGVAAGLPGPYRLAAREQRATLCGRCRSVGAAAQRTVPHRRGRQKRGTPADHPMGPGLPLQHALSGHHGDRLCRHGASPADEVLEPPRLRHGQP